MALRSSPVISLGAPGRRTSRRSRAERAAFEQDPTSLRSTIPDPDSAFRDYRESYVGAYRAGEQVPLSQELDRELRKYEGYSSPYEELPVEREVVPSLGPPTPTEEPYATPAPEPPPDTSAAFYDSAPYAERPPEPPAESPYEPVPEGVPYSYADEEEPEEVQGYGFEDLRSDDRSNQWED